MVLVMNTLFLLLTGCGGQSGENPAWACQVSPEVAPTGSSVAFGGTVDDAVALVEGTRSSEFTAELPDDSWSAPGTLVASLAGDVLAYHARGDVSCPHDEWVEVPLSLRIETDDAAIEAEVDATGTVWGTDISSSKLTATVVFADLGPPFRELIDQAKVEAEAAGCEVGAPYDEVLLTGTLDVGHLDFAFVRSCEDGNRVEEMGGYPIYYSEIE